VRENFIASLKYPHMERSAMAFGCVSFFHENVILKKRKMV
jgi:hypothetical protein